MSRDGNLVWNCNDRVELEISECKLETTNGNSDFRNLAAWNQRNGWDFRQYVFFWLFI